MTRVVNANELNLFFFSFISFDLNLSFITSRKASKNKNENPYGINQHLKKEINFLSALFSSSFNVSHASIWAADQIIFHTACVFFIDIESGFKKAKTEKESPEIWC
jgi:hypothetical protein